MRSCISLCLQDMEVAWLHLLFLLASNRTLRKEVWLPDRSPVLCITPVPYCESVTPSLFFLRTRETILPLLCMANSSSDLQAHHFKLLWDHPSEKSKQRYLSLTPTLLRPTARHLFSCMQPCYPAWVLGCWSTGVPSSVCVSLHLAQS